MKTKLFSALATSALLLGGGLAGTANASEKEKEVDVQEFNLVSEDGEITPYVHYDYSIPNFTLGKGENAFTTRSGYGFFVNKEGLNHNDFDISFNVYTSGSSTPKGILALVKFSDWENATKRQQIIDDPASYAAKFANFSGSGDKSISFLDQAWNTKWVFLWKNTGEGSFTIRSGKVDTSY